MARTKAPDPPRKLDPSIPKPLDAICQKALAFRKQDRYQSAIALAEDVQRYLAGDPVEAYRENLLERTWRWVRKHQKGLGRAAAALLVLGTALTAFFIVKEANRRRAEAIQEFADLSRKDTARQEVNRFRNLAEEARFFAANADPSEENAPFFDPKKGEAKAQDALAVAKAWGPALEDFPLDATLRSDLKQELYDLLVLTAQVKTRTGDEAEGLAALSLLDQAATLAPPMRGLHRLRAQGHTLAKETAKAEAEDKQANDPKAPRRALDHFLQGEKHRAEASRLTFEKDKDQKDKDKKSKDPKVLVLEQAIDEYREALKIDPDDYWSHYQLGRTYLALGRGLQAVERLSTCVALKPAMPWSYSARGFAAVQAQALSRSAGRHGPGAEARPRVSPGPAQLGGGACSRRRKRATRTLPTCSEPSTSCSPGPTTRNSWRRRSCAAKSTWRTATSTTRWPTSTCCSPARWITGSSTSTGPRVFLAQGQRRRIF